MIPPNHCLFLLPIHRRSSKEYLEKGQQAFERNRHKCEKEFCLDFDKISDQARMHFTNMCTWPYWFFNDIIGFVEVGFDGGIYLQGAVYLKMKLLYKGHHDKKPCASTLQKQQLFQEIELRKRPIHLLDEVSNDEIHEVVEELLSEARSRIRKRFRTAEIWRPGYKLDCLDLVKACKQVKECGRIGH